MYKRDILRNCYRVMKEALEIEDEPKNINLNSIDSCITAIKKMLARYTDDGEYNQEVEDLMDELEEQKIKGIILEKEIENLNNRLLKKDKLIADNNARIRELYTTSQESSIVMWVFIIIFIVYVVLNHFGIL